MTDLNVFEMTNMALKNLDAPKAKKSVKESVKSTSKKSVKENKEPVKISYKKLKLESVASFKESEDTTDFTPEDEVVLVIDTEMEEVPETEEAAVEAAQELVGDTVCKCSVCGANYICTCDTIEEDVDGEVTMVAEEEVCPICGEEAPQIVVGEIVADTEEAPAEEDEKSEEPAEKPAEEETEVEVEADADVEATEEPDEDEFDFSEFDVEEDEEVEEACNRKPSKKFKREQVRRPMRRMESAKNVRRHMRKTTESRKPMARPSVKRPTMENRKPMNRPAVKRTAVENRRPMRRSVSNTYNFNESALNRLFNKFATENYENVKSVKFTNGSLNRGVLTLEGIVTTLRGSKRNIKLVAEGMNNVKSGRAVLKAREIGPFTESAIKSRKRVPFVIECVVRGNSIVPVGLKYAYTTTNSGLKESRGRKETFKVFGQIK